MNNYNILSKITKKINKNIRFQVILFTKVYKFYTTKL